MSLNLDLRIIRRSIHFELLILVYIISLSWNSIIHFSEAYHFPPSILTFNEEYIGKELRFDGFSEEKKKSSSVGWDEADYILPICCDMDNGDVISFQCQNTLAASPKEVILKRKTWIAPKHLVSSKASTKFRFISSSIKCKSRSFSSRISLNSSLAEKGTYFLLDGYFKHQNEYFRPDEFCISGISRDQVEVQICPVDCTDPSTPCINKCCGKDQIYSFGYGDHPRGCIDIYDEPSRAKWFPTLYHTLKNKLSIHESLQLNPHIIHKFPTSFKYNCRFNKTTVFPHGKGIASFLTSLTQKTFRNLEFRVRKDGWLLYPRQNETTGKMVEAEKHIQNYCIDGAQDYGESTEFSNLESESVLFLCSGGVDEESENLQNETGNQKASEASSIQLPKPNVTKTTTIFIGSLDQHQESTELLEHFNPIPSSSLEDSSSHSHSIEVLNSVEENFSQKPSLSTLSPIIDSIPKTKPSHPNPTEKRTLPPKATTPKTLTKSNIKYSIPQVVTIMGKKPLAQITKKKPVLAQTTFNHNNHELQSMEQFGPLKKYSEIMISRMTPKYTIPTCCNFNNNLNDGFTHHCRNKRMDSPSNHSAGTITYTPTWNVSPYFMTKDKGASFSLSSSPITCGSGRFQFQGFIHNFEQEKANYPGEKKHGILADGFLKYNNEFYSPEEYCINGLSPRIVEVIICKPDCSMWETPCLQKCCGLDEIYNLGLGSGNRGCQPLNKNDSLFNPILYHNMSNPLTNEEMKSVQPHFVQKYPPNFQLTCHNQITLAFPFSKEIASKLTPANSAERGGVSFKHLSFRFRKDGKLIYTYPEPDGTSFDTVYDKEEFCVDAVRDYGEKESFKNQDNQTILFICASEPHSSEQ